MKTYAQKLQAPRWQKARLRKLDKAGWACENCGNDKEQLHVHHPVYVKGREPWQYEDDELQVLCHICHADHHAAEAELSALIVSNSDIAPEIFGVVAGWVSPELKIYPQSAMGRTACGEAVAVGQVARLLYTAPNWLKEEVGEVIRKYLESKDA